MDTIERLEHYWSSHGLEPERRATAESLRAFEEAHHVTFPEDVRRYLLRLNGLATFGTGADGNGFGFFPLGQLRPVKPEEYPPGFKGTGYFVFAEYLGWSWAYALQLADSAARGEVIHIGTMKPKVIAASFSQFIELYLVDSPNLYPDLPENR
jgi:hypothetical protein